MTDQAINHKNLIFDRLTVFLIIFLIPIFHVFKATDIICFYCIFHMFWGVLTKENPLNKQTKRVQFSFLLFIIYITVLLPYGYTTKSSFIRVIQLIGCLSAFTYGAIIQLDDSISRFILWTANALSILIISYWILFSRALFNFTLFHLNPNGTGLISLMIFYIVYLVESKRHVFFLFIPAFIVLISTSRSALIAILYLFFVSFTCSVSTRFFNSKKKVSTTLFFLTLSIISIITFLYPLLSTSDYALDLTLFSQKYFNKNMFSGRQIIWSELIEFIKLKPVFGYGLATTPTHLFDTDFSSHNLYLQTCIQCGFTGIFLLVLLLGSFFIRCDLPNTHYSIRFYSILLSFLLQQCFEVSLTQNMLPISLIIWFIIGLGFNYSLHGEEEQHLPLTT